MSKKMLVFICIALSLICWQVGKEEGRREAAAKYYAEMQNSMDSLILKYAQGKAELGINYKNDKKH